MREIAGKKGTSANQKTYPEKTWAKTGNKTYSIAIAIFHVYILGRANETRTWPQKLCAGWNIL